MAAKITVNMYLIKTMRKIDVFDSHIYIALWDERVRMRIVIFHLHYTKSGIATTLPIVQLT